MAITTKQQRQQRRNEALQLIADGVPPTERALYAKIVASEANWMESQSCERLIVHLRARQDFESFREGFKAKES